MKTYWEGDRDIREGDYFMGSYNEWVAIGQVSPPQHTVLKELRSMGVADGYVVLEKCGDILRGIRQVDCIPVPEEMRRERPAFNEEES